jgi:hypothetical protein
MRSMRVPRQLILLVARGTRRGCVAMACGAEQHVYAPVTLEVTKKLVCDPLDSLKFSGTTRTSDMCTFAELLPPQFLIPAIRRAQWGPPARHVHTLHPASPVTANCRGATSGSTAVFATGYTPRSVTVGPARHLYTVTFLPSPPTRLRTPITPPSGAVKLERPW